MAKVVFPSFRTEGFSASEMRQFVSAVEFRFQSLEQDDSSLFDTQTDDLDNRYAQLSHTHVESEITDLQHISSIFELDDVVGTPSQDDILIWDDVAGTFIVSPAGSGSFGLDDLTDVSVPAPNDEDVLVYDAGAGQWVAAPPASAGGETFVGLNDTDLSSQQRYDLVFNATGTEWRNTRGELIWDPDKDFLQLAFDHSINWLNSLLGTVELLEFTGLPGTPASPTTWAEIDTFSQVGSSEFYWTQSFCFKFNDTGTRGYVASGTLGQGFGRSSGTYSTPYIPEDSLTVETVFSGSPLIFNYFDWGDDGTLVFISTTGGTAVGINTYSNSGTAFNPTSGDLTLLRGWQASDVGASWTTVSWFFWKPDGTRVFTGTTGNAWAYDCSTAWDTDTAVYNSQTYNFNDDRVGNVEDIQFDPSGTVIYVLQNQDVWEYHLSTAWDISTATYQSRFIQGDTGTAGGGVRSLDVSPDGRTLIIQSQWGNDVTRNDTMRWTTNESIPGTPAVEGETAFIVGDPDYPTELDGTYIGLKNNIGINWDDAAGDNVEFLIFAEVPAIPATWGPPSDFTETAETVENVDLAQGFSFAYDGSRALVCASTTDAGIWITGPFATAYTPDGGTAAKAYDSADPTNLLYGACFNRDGTKVFAIEAETGVRREIVEFNNTGTPFAPGTGELVASGNVYDYDTDHGNLWGLWLNEDGTELYAIATGANQVAGETRMVKYSLTTANTFAGGVTEVVAQQSFDIETSPVNASPQDFTISPDGQTLYYLSGFNNGTVYEFSMSTAFDLTTLAYVGNSFVPSMSTGTRLVGIDCAPDGDIMVVQGYFATSKPDTRTLVHTSTSGTPGIPGSEAFFVGDPQHPTEIDGTYVGLKNNIGINWDDASGDDVELLILSSGTPRTGALPEIDQVAYNSTSAVGFNVAEDQGFTFNGDGTILYTSNIGDRTIRSWALSTPYDLSTLATTASAQSVALFTVSPQYPLCPRWSSDGLTLFYLNYGNGEINSQTVTTPYSITELTGSPDVTKQLTTDDITGFFFSADGTKLLYTTQDGDLGSYEMTVPYDIANAAAVGSEENLTAQMSACSAVVANDDGTQVWVLSRGQATETVYQYTLATAWRADTSSYDSKSLVLDGNPEDNSTDMFVDSVRGELYVGWYGTPAVDDGILEKYVFTPLDTEELSGFFVGDPNTPLELDGSFVGLKNNIGVNWDDDFGDNVELINFSPESGWQGWPTSLVDPLFGSVELLLNLNEASGSTTTVDSSSNAHPVTLNNSAILDDTYAASGSTSMDNRATDAHAAIPDDTTLRVLNNNFCIEGWYFWDGVQTATGNPATHRGHFAAKWTNTGTREWNWGWRANGNLNFGYSTNGTSATDLSFGAYTPPADTWVHYAVVRDGADIRMYVDGVQFGSTQNIGTDTIIGTASSLYVGAYTQNGTLIYEEFPGWIDSFRLTVGDPRYTSNFTPPTPSAQVTFVLGDPLYKTRLDGPEVSVTEDLNVGGTAIFNGGATFVDSTTMLGKINASVVVVTTTSYTIGDEHVILVDDDTAGSAVTLTLPAAATANTLYHVKKIGTTAEAIIDGDASETIDGELSITLRAQYESVMLISNGTFWSIL